MLQTARPYRCCIGRTLFRELGERVTVFSDGPLGCFLRDRTFRITDSPRRTNFGRSSHRFSDCVHRKLDGAVTIPLLTSFCNLFAH